MNSLVLPLLICCIISTYGYINPVTNRFNNQQLKIKTTTKLYDISDKLVFDDTTGRMYEQNMDERLDDSFCLIDEKSGKPILLTKEEKERIFLDAIQSYYFKGESNIKDDEFDALREDLAWEGSVLVSLNREEAQFMNAMQAYMKGKPIMNDSEFDNLKLKLKESGSMIAVDVEPKCYVDTGVCKTTWLKDSVRTGTLYLPASLLLSIVYTGIIYEIPFIHINPIIALILGFPAIFSATKLITEGFLFKDPLVASGPCPSCSSENSVFFGDVLGVEGDFGESTVKCNNCKTQLTIKQNTLRVSTLIPKEKARKPPPSIPAPTPSSAA